MTDEDTKTAQPLSAKKLVRVFMGTMLLYLGLVHVWSLWLPPIGGEYIWFAKPFGLPWGYRHFFQAEIQLFNDWVVGYHLVNLALLYGCMVALFFLTWHILRGPIWFGSLAATLMMAHPMKTEAVLQLSGSIQLLPALFSLAFLAYYSAYLRWGRLFHLGMALLTFVMLSPLAYTQLGLLGVLLVMELGVKPKAVCQWWRPIPFVAVSIVSLLLVEGEGWHFEWQSAFVTLFLTVYPFGLTPETASRLIEEPRFFALAALTGVIITVAFGVLIRQRAYWIMLAAAILYMVMGFNWGLDWVHLSGGGSKIVLISLALIAICAVVQNLFMAEYWRRPLILMTALLCIFFFGLQIREIAHWHFAAREIRKVEEQIQVLKPEDGKIIVAPAFRFYHTALMLPGISFYYDTPFNEKRNIQWILDVDYQRGEEIFVRIENDQLIMESDREYAVWDVDCRGIPRMNGEIIDGKRVFNRTIPEDNKYQLLVPFGVQEGDTWVIRTPKTWLQRLREWEIGEAESVE